jgi:hypothetical protein
MINRMKTLILIAFVIAPVILNAQRQYADTLFTPEIDHPVYPEGSGPVICIDEGHHNFHTKDGRYRPFADLLERDGYFIDAYLGAFEPDKLDNCDILVISNALSEINVQRWYKPIYSAFTDTEIDIVKKWVEEGGSLFLIADHMPMAGGAAGLAGAFGYSFNDGFATDSTRVGPDLFTRSNGQIPDNEITGGKGFMIDSIMTFTGQAFEIPDMAIPILKCGKTWVSYQPDTAWQINEHTPVIRADTLYQGAYQRYGKGRLVVFGEAAMFSAQIAETGGRRFKAGMNREGAEHNYKLLLNIIHWLDPKRK